MVRATVYDGVENGAEYETTGPIVRINPHEVSHCIIVEIGVSA